MDFKHIAILGPGLIGGSIALALKKHSPSTSVTLWARREKAVEEVLDKKITSHATSNLKEAVSNSDLIILCTPIEVMGSIVSQFIDEIAPTTLITDAGSVKASVDQELAPLIKDKCLWLGSHPMAGSEQSGIDFARSDLFEGATTVLTPTHDTPESASKQLALFWKTHGSHIVSLSPQTHDCLVAEISHLPHLVASLLVASVSEESLDITGTGFKDTTRIAAGSPELWKNIILENQEAVLKSLKKFQHHTDSLYQAISQKNKAQLEAFLQQARDQRKKVR